MIHLKLCNNPIMTQTREVLAKAREARIKKELDEAYLRLKCAQSNLFKEREKLFHSFDDYSIPLDVIYSIRENIILLEILEQEAQDAFHTANREFLNENLYMQFVRMGLFTYEGYREVRQHLDLS